MQGRAGNKNSIHKFHLHISFLSRRLTELHHPCCRSSIIHQPKAGKFTAENNPDFKRLSRFVSRGLFVLTEQRKIALSSHPEFVCTVVDTLYSLLHCLFALMY